MGGVAHFMIGGRFGCGVSDEPLCSASTDIRFVGCRNCIRAIMVRAGEHPRRGVRT